MINPTFVEIVDAIHRAVSPQELVAAQTRAMAAFLEGEIDRHMWDLLIEEADRREGVVAA